MIVSIHAEKRAKERLGLPKKAVERNVKKALRYGILYTEFRGQFRRYLNNIAHKQTCDTEIRVMARYVYLFRDGILVTVIPVPCEFRKIADKIKGGNENA